MIRSLIDKVLDNLYPCGIYCICCGKIIDRSRPYSLCNDCMDTINWADGRTCSCCGKPLHDNNPLDECFSCREHSHEFHRGYCCAGYGTLERKLLLGLKYDGKSYLARNLGEIMADRMLSVYEKWELDAEYDLVVPVPASADRKSRRGYNQAALLAEYFVRSCGLEHKYRGEILYRIKSTQVMKFLSPEERRINIRGSFGIIERKKPALEGARCLVIDDIYTTGATVDEVCRELKANGAGKIDFLSFASGSDVIKS